MGENLNLFDEEPSHEVVEIRPRCYRCGGRCSKKIIDATALRPDGTPRARFLCSACKRIIEEGEF